jgi:hypothetical protein
VQTVTLRSGPDAGAAVVETVAMNEFEGVEILEAGRERLRVKIAANADAEGGTRVRDTEGWAGWDEVTPYASAIVVDAEGGEVLGRIPLVSAVGSVAFSPDGNARPLLQHGRAVAAREGSSHGPGGRRRDFPAAPQHRNHGHGRVRFARLRVG